MDDKPSVSPSFALLGGARRGVARVADLSPWVRGQAGPWRELFRGGRREAVRRGHVLAQPGEPCDRLFLLESGRVSVALTWHDGSEKTIGVVLPGAIFGETCFFRPDLANLAVRADEDSVVCSLGREDVTRCLEVDPGLALILIGSLTRKFWMLVRQIEDLRFRPVAGRVAGVLCSLAVGSGLAADGDGEAVALDVTHAALADLVGAHRVSVTNSLKDLERRGLIEVRPRRIMVRDLDGLYRAGFGPAEWPAPTEAGVRTSAGSGSRSGRPPRARRRPPS